MSKGNAIPTHARRVVDARDQQVCQRCGGRKSALHHRRRRNTKNGHDQHCACVLVSLCGTCHSWAHANPRAAMDAGYIVSSYEDEPWKVPIQIFTRDRQFNHCDGTYTLVEKVQE